MYDLDAIEAINIDQLVTATDRLLVVGARNRTTRRSIDLALAARAAVTASDARRAGQEKTVHVRGHRGHRDVVVAFALLAGAWLGAVGACLLA